MLNFDFLEIGPEIVSPLNFVYDFSRRNVAVIFYKLSSDQFPILLEILGNMCIATVCVSGFDVINFEINLIFLAVFLHGQKVKKKI